MTSLTDKNLERKKLGLTYLYYYHENYKSSSIDEKKRIRDYYDNTLRYKGSFYKDKKQFITYGHPSKWEERKINRFVIHPEKPAFERGKNLYSIPFQMLSPNLIQINIFKQTDIEIIKIIDDYYNILNDYKQRIVKEIRKMKNLMQRIDTVKETVKVKLGYNYGIYNLGYLQVIFKLQINTIVRHIGITYQPSKVVEILAINRLEKFLRVITNLESALRTKEGEIIGESNIFPDDFEITEIKLIGLELNKRTNLSRTIREYKHLDYVIELSDLKSREVL